MSITNVPPEVLLQIFHHAIGDGPLRLGGTAVAFPISQGCRDWRQIALDSPTLWDDVRFPHGAYAHGTSMLDELLERSGTRSLRAVFSYSEPRQTINFAPFFHKMAEFSHRFRAIYAILPKHAMLQFSGQLGHHIFPLLVHLHIVQDDYLTPMSVAFYGPALVQLHIENCTSTRIFLYTGTRSVHPQVPGTPAPAMWHDLHKLTIIHSPLPMFNHAGPIPQLALTSLILDGITSSGVPEFLMSFRMPHLRHIELGNLDNIFQSSSQIVRALSPGSPAVYPALRSAKFTSLSLSEITPYFCHALPGLETLVLVDLDPAPLLKLLRKDNSLWPALGQFYIDGHLQRR